MSVFTHHKGRAVPLRGNDIDTDRIIPARYLRCVTFAGLGEHAFADDRSQLKAAGRLHPFDDPQYAGADILLVGSNFGCGSSREHAPQSLRKWGVRVILGVSFAEIFFNNNLALGLPCFSLSIADADFLMGLVEDNPQLEVEVDLALNRVVAAEFSCEISMPEGARQMFLRGTWDATAQLLENLDQVRQRSTQLPYLNRFSTP